MTLSAKLLRWRRAVAESLSVFMRDAGNGLLEVGHNTLALLGLCVVAALLFAGTRADLRHGVERHALDWLLERQEVRNGPPVDDLSDLAEPTAVSRATAVDPADLPRGQAAIAGWLSRRYKVAPEPLSRLVQEAWSVGHRLGVDPTLVLAVMAIESGFNPFAQSQVGAQGLMQVVTRIHDDKYQAFGGVRAAFDPVTNLRVGVQILKECIERAGSLEAGLRYYVGAALSGRDGGYVNKVLAERTNLRLISEGKSVSIYAALPAFRPAAPTDATDATTAAEQPLAPASSASNTARDQRVALLN